MARKAGAPITIEKLDRLPPSDRIAKPGECPFCFGTMIDIGGVLFCPAEDPHPGGVLQHSDGRLVRLDRHL